jgi:SAM-dependent methyltransferase
VDAAATAAERWRAELEAWAIPEEILAQAPESPWGFPAELWRATDHLTDDTPSRRRALETLPPGGSVLDVGCGGGRAGLSIAVGAAAPAPPALVGVDESEEMLAAFEERAGELGMPHRSVVGRWPDVAGEVEPADVVVCHHVLYNVPDPVPFVGALAAHARRRVVVEVTECHPLVVLAPLWKRFHGLDRPDGPRAALLGEVLREAGIDAEVEGHTVEPRHMTREQWVAFTRRRLCLPASREAEVDAALGPGPALRENVTFWWDVAGGARL